MKQKWHIMVGLLVVVFSFEVATTDAQEETHLGERQKIGEANESLSQGEGTKEEQPVALFDAMEEEKVEVWLVQQNSLKGQVFIKNKTKKPLKIELPPTFAGVLKQQVQQRGGGGQQVGGGLGALQGLGIFSIEPDTVSKIGVKTVCLQYGLKEPNSRMKYTIAPLETAVSDPRAEQIITMLATNEIDQGSAQAAMWHVTDSLSWQYLYGKRRVQPNGFIRPYFSERELYFAVDIEAEARLRAIKKRESLRVEKSQKSENQIEEDSRERVPPTKKGDG
ncbi:MAG: hypothetical protein MPJ24_08625 [Pirellulaceae bacterium]|nr:hypothetical protein [Pirellulaceae bacterium]